VSFVIYEKGSLLKSVSVMVMLLVASAATVRAQVRGPQAEATARPPASPPAPSAAIFLGGVPSGTVTPGAPTIPVIEAIRRALDHNLGVLTAAQAIDRAGGVRWRALSELLPTVDGRVSEVRQTVNLQAFGFGSFGSAFGDVPVIVGPFNVFDARVSLSQRLLDLGAIRTARSETHNLDAARQTHHAARNLVVHVAGTLYIQALAASARADAARAQLDTAQALHRQALDLKQSGIIAGVDVLRAEVQLSTATQRTTAAANELDKAKLQLARVIGLPLGQDYTLDANIPELPHPDLTLEQAVERAYRSRPDYQAALARVKAAEAALDAVAGDRLPSVRLNADYGDIGLSPADARGTYSVSGVVTVPVFQGGRLHGRRLEAEADVRDRRSETEDLKAAIYYDIRTAFLDLQATTEQLQVATKTRDLAARQLAQARDRFAAGIASNVEVVQAQEAVALAAEQYISARYGYDLAKGALFRGTGSTEEMLRQISRGSR
jgi:outer membrane protein TolC